jgi:hypothetical protein
MCFIRSLGWTFLVVLCVLSACGDREQLQPAPTDQANIRELLLAKPTMVALQEVVDTYVVGSRHTDLQRELLDEKLQNATVLWQLTVFDVVKDGERYKLTSELMSGTSASSIGKFAVVAFININTTEDKRVIPPISTDLRSRTFMQPWPDAALG